MAAKEETVCSFQEIVLVHCDFKPRITASLSWSYKATSVQTKHRRTMQVSACVKSGAENEVKISPQGGPRSLRLEKVDSKIVKQQ